MLMIVSFAAQSSDKRIDFGAQSTVDVSTYEVGFCARAKNENGDGPGHAFVMFRKFDASQKVVEFYTGGLTPGNKRTPYTQNGLIEPEMYSDPTQECLIANTNKDKYTKALEYATLHGEYTFGDVTINIPNTYSLLTNDCVTFMGAVAEYFGLQTPSRVLNMTPMSFVTALKAKY
jgi:hypothetical protein